MYISDLTLLSWGTAGLQLIDTLRAQAPPNTGSTILYRLGSRRTALLFRQFAHSFNGGPAHAMGSIVISVKCSLSWNPASKQFFLLSKVRFQRCAETRRSRAKSTQSRAASSSPWSTFLSTVRSDLPHAQPMSGHFALKFAPGY